MGFVPSQLSFRGRFSIQHFLKCTMPPDYSGGCAAKKSCSALKLSLKPCSALEMIDTYSAVCVGTRVEKGPRGFTNIAGTGVRYFT